MRAFNPPQYWERRYARGHDSGEGSRGAAAEAKAKYLAELIETEQPATIVDLGCGDGTVVAELERLGDQTSYLGLDLSRTVIDANRKRFAAASHRRFELATFGADPILMADLAVSADVLHHFPDQPDLWTYLDQVMAAAGRLAAIYATDHEAGQTAYHCAWWHWTMTAEERYAGDGWTLDSVRQGRRTKRESIDPTEPAWYLWRREPALETPAPRPPAAIEVHPPATRPGTVGPMTSDPELLPSGGPGKG